VGWRLKPVTTRGNWEEKHGELVRDILGQGLTTTNSWYVLSSKRKQINYQNHDSMIEVMNMGDVQKIDKQMKQSSRCRFGWEKPLDSKEPFI
jgi:hypothetical protein